TLAVRSLDGSGQHNRDLVLDAPKEQKIKGPFTPVSFTLNNTGTAVASESNVHPGDVSAFLNSDVYRLTVSVGGEGWTAKMLNGLAALKFGESQKVEVYVSQEDGGAPNATVTLQAISESDPSKSATATVQVSR
ncbi:peptidase M6, partial [Acidobacteriota bacterium]